MMNTFNKQHGFTIIEALMAALLLATGLMLLYSMMNKAVFIQGDIAGAEIAAMLADETLDRINCGLDTFSTEKTSLSGGFSEHYPNYSWAATLDFSKGNIVKIDLEVLWSFNNNDKSFLVSTYLYKGGQAN